MHNAITLTDCRSYATEANLHKGLKKLGLDDYRDEPHFMPCRYIIARTPDGRWTAIFLASAYFAANKTGGYIGFASQHGFMSI